MTARAAALIATLTLSCAAGCGGDAGPPGLAKPGIRLVEATRTQPDSNLALELHHELSAPVVDALQHGVALTFEWRLEQRQPRRFLWDARSWSESSERQVSYRSLARRYTLVEAATGAATSYPSLTDALAELNRVEVKLPPAQGESYLRLRARLVLSRLPPALRLPSFLSDQWKVDSGWVRVEPT
ncbi:MAG: DUF4390 domain-containing protein [Pseudomonadota bacterium]